MVGIDKLYHFIAGFIIALVITYYFAPFYGLLAGYVAGTLKELWDEYSYGGGDVFDFFATALGSIFAVLCYQKYIGEI